MAPTVPSIADLDDPSVWRLALDLLDRGLPFHAHEVFEERWRTAPAADRQAWRALAQWGAALTHDARGNDIGAARLAQRAMETLDSATAIPACIDAPAVRASCRALVG